MTVSLSTHATRAILLDIEGTTTPAAFVYDTLFPFARAHAAEYLHAEWASDACRGAVELLGGEHAADLARREATPSWVEEPLAARVASVAAYVGWLIDRDRKSPGLKALQGHIWRRGYASGELRGQVFADVPPALERWRAQRLEVCIYSSGSVLAQQLLFQTTEAGDLTRLLSRYFDLDVGPKTSPESYRRIAGALEMPAADMLFVSDVAAELDAAQAAGLRTILCVRRPASAPMSPRAHSVIRTFNEIGD